MWDNTLNKRNPKSPDYKCKDRSCGKAVWVTDKNGTAKPEFLDKQAAHEDATIKSIRVGAGLAEYEAFMLECLKAAERIMQKTDLVSDPQALATTFYIQGYRR